MNFIQVISIIFTSADVKLYYIDTKLICPRIY